MSRFEVIWKGDAKKLGLWDGYDSSGSGSVIVENLPNGTRHVIGWDGGEPEDQLIVRDWAWVVVELNRAFQAGIEERCDKYRETLRMIAGGFLSDIEAKERAAEALK